MCLYSGSSVASVDTVGSSASVETTIARGAQCLARHGVYIFSHLL